MDRCCENCVHGDMDNSCTRELSEYEMELPFDMKVNEKEDIVW